MTPGSISSLSDFMTGAPAKPKTSAPSKGADFADVLSAVAEKPTAKPAGSKPAAKDDIAAKPLAKNDKGEVVDDAVNDEKVVAKDDKAAAKADKPQDAKTSEEEVVTEGVATEPVVNPLQIAVAPAPVAAEPAPAAAPTVPDGLGAEAQVLVAATLTATIGEIVPEAAAADAAVAGVVAAVGASSLVAAGTAVQNAPVLQNAQVTPQVAAPITDTSALPGLGEGMTELGVGLATTPTAPATAAPTEEVATGAQAPAIEARSSVADAAMAKAALDSLSSATRVNEAQQTSSPVATKLTDTAMRSEPYQQVVKIIAPLKHMADGDYSMTMKLHPEHLGSVEITVALAGGQVNMSMNTDSQAARQMLRDSMNDLRQSLEQSGLNAGSLDVGSRDAGTQPDGKGGNTGAGWSTGNDVEENTFARFAVETPASVSAITDGPLDVRL